MQNENDFNRNRAQTGLSTPQRQKMLPARLATGMY